MDYIFDSHVFDALFKKDLNIDDLEKAKSRGDRFYITHIQVDEINDCANKDKRAILNLFMLKVAPKVVPTESFIIGRSRLGEAKLGTAGYYEKLRGGSVKHIEDALIGEVAIKNNMTLITDDNQLRRNVNKLNGNAISIADYNELIK